MPPPTDPPVFVITQGNTAPALVLTCYDDAGDIVDFTTATSATFTMWDTLGETVVEADAMTFVEPRDEGKLQWAQAALDVADEGTFYGKANVVWADGKNTSYPTNLDASFNVVTVYIVAAAGQVV